MTDEEYLYRQAVKEYNFGRRLLIGCFLAITTTGAWMLYMMVA